MARKPARSELAVNQTSQRSLKLVCEALREGRVALGTGIILKRPVERSRAASPVIILKDVPYEDVCALGASFPAYKWVAPTVLATAGPCVQADCEGRSCANAPCPDPCVCDPMTLRCVKFSI
jgi:hypothetical protein